YEEEQGIALRSGFGCAARRDHYRQDRKPPIVLLSNGNMAVTIAPTPAIDGRAQVERITQSKIFRASEVLRNLLVYLSEQALSGTADSLKEYTIGLDALGKPASFDPRQESVVRMHTARLRQKLAEYYRTDGIDDPIVVDMPKGGFRVTFEPRAQVAIAAPAPLPPPVISEATVRE